jgi:hypothetical protein
MQPASASQSPTSPPAPDAPAGGVVQIPGGPSIAITRTGEELSVPRTQAEVDALRARGEALSDQLISAQGRRDDIAEELAGLGGAGVGSALRTGLEQRLAQLDGRILRIEQDIAENGRLLAAAPPSLLSNSEVGVAPDRPFDLSSGQITGISIVSVIFVGMPLAIGAAVMMLRRSNRPNVPAVPTATQQRLERMEQAIDTIAIEMERVSENQRFLTRVLTEGPAQPIALDAKAGDAVRASDV